VTLLVQKGVGTRSHTKNRYGNAVPTRSHPTTPLVIRQDYQNCYIRHIYILVHFHIFVCSLLLRCMFEV